MATEPCPPYKKVIWEARCRTPKSSFTSIDKWEAFAWIGYGWKVTKASCTLQGGIVFFFCSLFIVNIQEDIVACPETHSVVGKIKSNQVVFLHMDILLVRISTLASEYFCFQFSFCYTVSHIASIVNSKHAFLWATSSRYAIFPKVWKVTSWT